MVHQLHYTAPYIALRYKIIQSCHLATLTEVLCEKPVSVSQAPNYQDRMKVAFLLALATLCLFSTLSEVKAADNEWLPYFILMSSSSSAPISLSPILLLAVSIGVYMLFSEGKGDVQRLKA